MSLFTFFGEGGKLRKTFFNGELDVKSHFRQVFREIIIFVEKKTIQNRDKHSFSKFLRFCVV
jgi:hypothetical protein